MTEEEILEVIRQWKFIWMNQRQNSEEDFNNYFFRAFHIDANMQHHLAKMIFERLTASQPGSRGEGSGAG